VNWLFLRYRIVDGDTMNPDDLNLYYEAVWNEATALTGFNFEYESLVVGTDIEDGAIIRVRTTSIEADHGIDVATNDGAPTVYDPTPAITGLIRSRSDFEWRVIVTETVTVSTCNLWVIFSWQQGVTDPTPSTFKGGCQYVLAIDGVPIMETMTGSGEKHTDVNGEGYGGTGANEAMVIDAVISLLAGTHTVSALWRQTRAPGFDQPEDEDCFMILNRELIIVELY
jgi:hypothetical protein